MGFLDSLGFVGDIIEVGADLFGGSDDGGNGGGGDSDFDLGGTLSGIGSIVGGLGDLGTQLIEQGVTEEELQIERDRLELQKQQLVSLDAQRAFENQFAGRKLQLEIALEAIRQAKEAVPDRTDELTARRQQITQAAADSETQIDALDRLVARFQGALR